jgi:hypothetical protein
LELHRFTALSPHLADPNFDDAAQNIDHALLTTGKL